VVPVQLSANHQMSLKTPNLSEILSFC